MRDLLVASVLLSTLPVCFRRPYVGVLVFSLLSYMRIQDLAWGFARYQRWSFYVALLALAGYLIDPRRKPPILELRTWLLILLMLLVGVGMAFATGEASLDKAAYAEYCKVIYIALFTTAVVQTRDQLRFLVWTIALSFAFYGVKSGTMGLLSGGALKIQRGPGGMLEDNNAFALALAMAVPLMIHLATSEKRQLFRRALWIMAPLTMLAVLLTYSRGAFLAMSFGIVILLWRSQRRVAGLSLVALAVVGALLVLPQAYVDRIRSIKDYETEGSARGRIDAWIVAWNMIEDNPLLGVGLDRFRSNYIQYDYNRPADLPEDKGTRVAHNSYFQIWAECGTPAFLIYMLLLFLTFNELWAIQKEARRRYNASWILSYATAFEASMGIFLVGAVFLNRAHFDLTYHFMTIVMILGRLARAEMADRSAAPVALPAAARVRAPALAPARGAARAFRKTSVGRGA